jgi:hypothetical protein
LPTLIALVGWIFLFATSGLATILYSLGVLGLGIIFYFGWSRIWGVQNPIESK